MAEKTDLAFKPGVWNGNYLDAFGYRCEITLTSESKGNEITGKFNLTIATEDEPRIVTGNFSGIHEKEGMLNLKLVPEKSKEPLEFNVHILDAKTYATQCISGIVKAPADSEFGGGVWIAWRYSKYNK